MRPLDVSYAEKPPDGDNLLAAVRFTTSAPAAEHNPADIVVPLQGNHVPAEVWQSPIPVQAGHAHGIAYRENAGALAGYLSLNESEYRDLEELGLDAYQRILRLAGERGFPSLLRVAHYLPHITEDQQGMERYQRFCVGRQQALEAIGHTKQALPAACGIGPHEGPICLYFLAAREPGQQIENPRQVSAFDYPARYSPKSPAFSRALLKNWGETSHLYISGTASITGHESRHVGDLQAQTREALTNVQALIDTANEYDQGQFSLTENALWRVYVRREADMPIVCQDLQSTLGKNTPFMLLHADLCRRELLVEIEGMCTSE